MASDYMRELKRKRDEIIKESYAVYIVNAGRMNHGKSSLFNSLLNCEAEIFKAEDKRTTVKRQEEKWKDGVFLIDTPGLDADNSDDTEAYEAYRHANMVLFVHTAKTGELHKQELDGIVRIASQAPSENYFWEHFCLAITFRDEYDDEEALQTIKRNCVDGIYKKCRRKDFPVFLLSNSRYQKGMRENKKNLVKKSGIPELRTYLEEHIPQWREENLELSRMQFKQEKDLTLEQVKSERKQILKNMDAKKDNIRRRQKEFMHSTETFLDGLGTLYAELEDAEALEREMKEAWRSLEREHEQAKARY